MIKPHANKINRIPNLIIIHLIASCEHESVFDISVYFTYKREDLDVGKGSNYRAGLGRVRKLNLVKSSLHCSLLFLT